MAAPLSPDRLLAALRAEGVRVVERPGWRTHNRNRAGAWGPVSGVMIHHTVTSGTAASVDLCSRGYDGLPGPLCHGVVAKDGTVHLVGHGRANHAGGGDPSVLQAVVTETYRDRPPRPRAHQGSAGAVDGNARFYGFECVNLGDGADPWPAAQLDAIERVGAALCRAHGWGARSVIGHLEWSARKVDPRGFAMSGMRERIHRRLGTAPSPQQPAPQKPAAPRYQPFPGTAFFRSGPDSPIVTAMGRRLVAEGCGRYRVGPGPRWSEADRKSYAAWQRKLGFTGSDADGWPGAASWNVLKVPYTT
ncbi:peptidoglycan-binding protein [Streptomyces somaliensis]|uniref:N-acetylmuramoyl-L-alanine amidase n=1 Tax=Streptomyces somaliensis (strain ATCC 33201 / DSM 40738 / JCM 12659 / KCTC 9044 / NCTC 11332 / NRRL B-12077 / IP 733) TaxID=1134445 RepID=A0AA44DF68_STRE0|nr:peptidoglycan-binding protein [Streptomyces somaliensis]NKY15389.1 N-acetylmuramoyl-L-alanine amidase [Streptomyces somaliensis DSM 40738]